MKVYCIGSQIISEYEDLTIGKIYDIIEERGRNYFYLENDRGIKSVYPRYVFQYIHQMRSDKLNKLGI